MNGNKGDTQPVEVLLVEDNPGDVDLIRDALGEDKNRPINLHVCGSLQEALKALESKRFDLVLLDPGLPDSDGEQFVLQILEAAHGISVIVCTEKHDPAFVKWCHEMGAIYLLKTGETIQHLSESVYNFYINAERDAGIKSILENVADGILAIDRQGKILFCNRAAENLLDCPATELVGTYFEYPIANETAIEIDLPHRQGGPGTVEMRVTETVFNGQVCHIVAMRDVTEQRKAAAALRESEERYRRLVESSPDIVYIFSTKKGASYWSPRIEEVLGISPAELQQNPLLWNQSIHPEDRPGVEKAIGAEGEAGQRVEYRIRDVHGNWHWFLDRFINKRRTGDEIIIEGLATDITDRKRTEEALAREAEANAAIAEVSQGLLVSPTLESASTMLLQQAQVLTGSRFGYVGSIDETTGHFTVDAITPEVWDRCKVVNEGLVFKKPSGLRGWVLENRKPLLTNDPQNDPRSSGRPPGHVPIERFLSVPALIGNKVVGMVSLANAARDYEERDLRIVRQLADIYSLIVQRFRHEEALRAAKEAAEDALEVKSKFLSNMSHEIRTPLNAILGFARLLANDPTLTPRQRKDVETINRAGEHLLNLINDILDFSKIEADMMELQPAPFCLHDTLETIEAMFRSQAEEKGLEMVVERDRTVPRHVVADEGKLRQVLINLLNNAVKFTEQGRITLRVKTDTPKKGSGEVRLIVEVEDTGPGIPEGATEWIFESFEQVEAAATSGGTGLGLAISRRIAQMMGGDISVRSEVGKGTCFRFEVLVQPTEAGPAEDTEARRIHVTGLAPGTGPVRALVVDDNQDNRALLGALLKRAGIEVEQAQDGREAVECFQRLLPHVVFMDIRMPVMDGYEAIRRIRDTEAGRHTPIIAVSASVSGGIKGKMERAGTDTYITKPFREEEIFSALEHLVGLGFVRADREAGFTKGPALVEPGVVAGLPKELVRAMRQAVEEGDVGRLAELLEQVEETDRALARALMALADRYDYERLLKILGHDEE